MPALDSTGEMRDRKAKGGQLLRSKQTEFEFRRAQSGCHRGWFCSSFGFRSYECLLAQKWSSNFDVRPVRTHNEQSQKIVRRQPGGDLERATGGFPGVMNRR